MKTDEAGTSTPQGWNVAPLGHFTQLVTYGFTNPMPTTESGPFMVTAKDIRGGRIDYAGARHTSQAAYETKLTDKSRPRIGDVLLTKDGSIGRVAVCDRDHVCINQSVALLRPNDLIGPEFLSYLLQAPLYQERMERDSGGSTIKHIYITRVDKMLIMVPPVREQLAITSVLAALDDKIAVNERIATTAVELADVEFLRVASGLTLSGETFGSVAEVVGGGTPSTRVGEYWGGDIFWTTPSDVTALASLYLFQTSRKITEMGLENCSSQLYPPQSIFMTSRATIGAFALPQVPAAVNQGFIVVLPPSEEMRWWLLHEMRSRVGEMISLANGSTFLELSRKNFKAMQIRLPHATEVTAFAQKAAPLHAAAAHATQENRTLATLRDTLLPQLMSGRLRVKDAEKIVEDAT